MKIIIDNGKGRKVPENDRLRFRAWHKPTKRLFEVWCFTPEYVYEHDEVNGIYTSPTNPAKFEDCVLEQCTGLKDKNGRLIYEGDIIRINNRKYEIYFFESFAQFILINLQTTTLTHLNSDTAPIHNIEIIGNIYEDIREGKK